MFLRDAIIYIKTPLGVWIAQVNFKKNKKTKPEC